MTESEFMAKKRWYELQIRAQVRAGMYNAIKAYIRNPGPGPQIPVERLRVIARGLK